MSWLEAFKVTFMIFGIVAILIALIFLACMGGWIGITILGIGILIGIVCLIKLG